MILNSMKVSVIIPAYNEPEGLKITLESLVNQSVEQDCYEVIVVDNGSRDHTLEVARQYAQRFPTKFYAELEHAIQGSYAARNKGISVAKGNILCFIDADMTVEREYIYKVLQMFEQESLDYLGCKVSIYTEHQTLAAKYNQLNGFKVRNELKHNQYVPTCCLSVRREIFHQVGLFDHRLESGGDFEFGQRVHKAGLIQKYADHIELKHPARWQYQSLKNKSKRVARGICQLANYFPDEYSGQLKKYFRIKRHLPKNPWSILKKAKKEQVPLNFFEALAIACYHVPLTLASSGEVKRYLKNQGWTNKTNRTFTLKTIS